MVRLLALSWLLVSAFTYRVAVPGYRYSFPRDHFSHPDFRTEWWYYTGNVWAEDGRRFGFELVFFRQGEREKVDPANKSVWRADDLYLAHLALTDVAGGRHVFTKRLNRAGPGVAGASFEQRRVWNANWSAQWSGDTQTLTAISDDINFSLRLTPVKGFVIQGENGVSQKAAGAGKASYYVSFPRLSVAGTLNGLRVHGQAWMDHEWFTHQLEKNQTGWDWFSVQLDDGEEFMLFQIRRADGSIDPYSSGTWIARDGRARHLRAGEFSLEPLERWEKYPIRWRIRIPAAKLELECRAVVKDQTVEGYWEGAVDYTGTTKGVGYLEMTGYAAPFRFE